MDENPQGMNVFISRQSRKRHLAAVWAGLAGLEPGMVVVDIGCGPGLLTREYARIIGANGIIFAVDNNESAAAQLADLPNVHFLFQRCDSDLKLEHIPNIVLITDKLQHVPEPEGILRQAFNICGPHTRILITGYDPKQPGLVGMKPRRRMAPETLVALVEAAGFSHGGVFDAPDEHYALLAQK
jgi:ubiquinone/menaquinone biosynthesis C-methylase UbiE